tara:strand:- start:220 stop:600 length:381 start_codon:yes stop_codon:yes gene_type:complete
MGLIDQVKGNRRIKLRKFTKNILIDNYIKAEDYFVELEAIIKDLTAKHKEEIQGLRQSHNEEAAELEEYYNNSNSYAYVRQILEELEKSNSEMEWYKTELEDLQQNGHQDLRKEIEQLRSKIVRMA